VRSKQESNVLAPLRRLTRVKGLRRAAMLLGLLALFGTVFASLDLQPSLRRMKLSVLSGVEGGNYHKVVTQLAEAARRDRGRITNVPTQGSAENLERLAAARRSCDVQVALVQDGLAWPEGLELLARLPRAESVFILGRDTDRIRTLKDLDGLRVGIGPEGSGTNRLARTILESEFLVGLQLRLSSHPLEEQLARLDDGSLDLAVMVIDEDAPLIVNAVRDRGLSILSLPQADVIARRLPRVHTGRIGAGQYDPVRLLPPVDKTVLRIETLVVGNGCASRSASMGLLTVLSREFPDFTRRNQDTANTTGLPLASASRSFFENGGPDLASQHLPWAIDIMPLSNWIYAITAVSLSFNLMTMWSRFRLWRLDARRAEIEERLEGLFQPNITPSELANLEPTTEHLTATHRAGLRALIDSLAGLRTLCRKQATGWVADMGEELPYRYQEHLMSELMRALRSFQARCDAAAGAGRPTGA
jgi:TRAP-type uncharacterized transport system substrate-binding protein